MILMFLKLCLCKYLYVLDAVNLYILYLSVYILTKMCKQYVRNLQSC